MFVIVLLSAAASASFFANLILGRHLDHLRSNGISSANATTLEGRIEIQDHRAIVTMMVTPLAPDDEDDVTGEFDSDLQAKVRRARLC